MVFYPPSLSLCCRKNIVDEFTCEGKRYGYYADVFNPYSLCCRKNIVDEFTCEGKRYGYYADVANDCQIFHICYPVQYPDGQEEMFKWSFICPNQTVFDQVLLKGQSHEI